MTTKGDGIKNLTMWFMNKPKMKILFPFLVILQILFTKLEVLKIITLKKEHLKIKVPQIETAGMMLKKQPLIISKSFVRSSDNID